MLSRHQSYVRIVAADQKGLTAVVIELCENHFRRFADARFTLIWYAMAKIQFHQYTQAEKALRRSIALFKKDKKGVRSASVQTGLLAASMKMGDLFRQKGDLKKAALWYRRGLQADPKYGDAYSSLGHVASKGGLLNEAERLYRMAISCSAQTIEEAHCNLGSVLVAKRR